jgi:microcystin-dependent protein
MFEGGDPSFPIWSGTFGSYRGTGTQLELTDLPKSTYPATISNNVSSGKFDVVSAVVDISTRLETEISEADFPAGGLEGQILVKKSDTSFDTDWVDNSLDELSDVEIDTPADNEVLTYDSSTSIWVNAQAVPAGVISQFAGASAPSGYLLCDGSAVSRTTYSALFAALNTTYGAGNGSTTFNIPNLQNRIPVGKGADVAFDVLGETGGSKTVTLSEANMAAHTHSGSTGNQSADHSHSGSTGTVSADHTHSGSTGTVSAGHTHDGTTGNQSADHTHTGTTGNQSAAHTHAGPSHQHTITVIDSRTSLQRGTGTTGTNTPDSPVTSKGTSFSGTQNTGTASSNHTHDITTGGVSANHTHSFTSGGQSANHTHSFSTGGISANHTHSFSTAVQSANHTHSFTTNSGTGTATPVNTLPPYIVVNYIIKT